MVFISDHIDNLRFEDLGSSLSSIIEWTALNLLLQQHMTLNK